ncbi:MAG: resuscitation-promoting factor RpfB [Pseudonocardiales bacterium]|nr:resuscitation-promoting factor RpfB [Pseudonocardiales bacterium]
MHRIVKFSLYGLVLAGLLAGTAAWAGSGKTVDLRVDGQDRSIHTTASDVRGALAAAHLSVGDHDIVAPDLTSGISDGSHIVLRRGHLLHLRVNGQAKDVWVNADSVDEALSQLGFTRGEFVSVSRSKRLDAGATSLSIDTPKRVTFLVDGKKVPVLTAGPTVYQAIGDAGLYLGPKDRLSAKGTIRDGQVIRIQRVSYKQGVEQHVVPFATVQQADPSNYVGTNTVVRSGRAGSNKVIYQLIYVDGRYAGRAVLRTVPISAPVSQITKVGSKPAPAFVQSVAPGSAQQIAAGMVAARGWGGDQFSCLVSLWTKESGWRTDAANPSGAYGIPQALPGSKMSAAGADWQTSASTQITWGLGYIAGVYGTPCAAWAHSQATNWY